MLNIHDFIELHHNNDHPCYTEENINPNVIVLLISLWCFNRADNSLPPEIFSFLQVPLFCSFLFFSPFFFFSYGTFTFSHHFLIINLPQGLRAYPLFLVSIYIRFPSDLTHSQDFNYFLHGKSSNISFHLFLGLGV